MNGTIFNNSQKIDKVMFIKLIKFTFEASYFSANSNFYDQVSGTPMGSPISPALANLVMNYILGEIKKKLNFDLLCLYLYVDDVFTIIPSKDIKSVHDTFNSIDIDVQFTIEVEKNNTLPYLDILIIKDDKKIVTNIYRKSISSDRILNFNSEHPLQQKINVVTQLIKKIYSLSHPRFHQDNLLTLKNFLISNHYPHSLIIKLMNQINSNNQIPKEQSQCNKTFLKIPLINNLTANLINILKDTKFSIASYITKSNRNLYSSPKDKKPLMQNSNIIYKIPCQDGCNLNYIGQTKQLLSARKNNHISDCNRSNINKNGKTALASHHFETGHSFNFNNIELLDRESNLKKRQYLEMIHINCTKDTINKQTDTNNLSKMYHNILNMNF